MQKWCNRGSGKNETQYPNCLEGLVFSDLCFPNQKHMLLQELHDWLTTVLVVTELYFQDQTLQ